MKHYNVFLICEAEEDIFEIYNYIAKYDSAGKVDKLFTNLKNTINTLDQQPDRSHVPPELESIDVFEFREIHYNPYRIIYQVTDEDVFVHCVFDGRHDLQKILQQRLLRQ